mgnify:CR=1 FL=1
MVFSRFNIYVLNLLEERIQELEKENATLRRKIYDKELEREMKREDRERYEKTGNWLFR